MESKQEPDLTTAPELESVLRELSNREPIFHRQEFGVTRADIERMSYITRARSSPEIRNRREKSDF
jgi:hypothetical protein